MGAAPQMVKGSAQARALGCPCGYKYKQSQEMGAQL